MDAHQRCTPFLAILTAGYILLAAIAPEHALGATPPNDDFRAASVLSGTGLRVTGTNEGATKEPGEPAHAGDAGGASVWWQWTAPNAGIVNITTENSDFDTVLAVYEGDSINTLGLVASNDDEDASLVTSRVTFAARAGAVYMIAVDGVFDLQPAAGRVRLTLTTDAPLRILSIRQEEFTSIRIQFTGVPGRSCAIEASSDLRRWTPLGLVINITGTAEFLDQGVITREPHRFYRIREDP